MVPIATYRDERKLLVLIGTVITAAVVTLIQVDAARNGRTSILSSGAATAVSALQITVSAATETARDTGAFIVSAPTLVRDNARLSNENDALQRENQRLREEVAEAPVLGAFEQTIGSYPGAVPARVIGYAPENETRMLTIDKGSDAGIKPDEGVITTDGVVGRIVEVAPFTSKILLLTDYTSNVPAVVQRGRWWGIARGTLTRINVTYISQDAKLRVGDRVVTGEGNVFHAGLLIGRIARVQDAGLYLTATVEPAVNFGSLEHVLILPLKS